jgi:hypothetical protein
MTTSVTMGSRSRSMRIASQSVIRSRTVSPTSRGCKRSSARRSASRPSGMRAVQRAPSAVPTRATRSPSAMPVARKSAIAARARTASAGSRCSSSNTITKWLPRRDAGWRFEDVRGSAAGGPAGAAAARAAGAGRCTASKAATSCGTPSSVTVKSSRRRSSTGSPLRPVATTSTVTISAWAGNEGCVGGAWALAAPSPRTAIARARATFGIPRPGTSLMNDSPLRPIRTISDRPGSGAQANSGPSTAGSSSG